TLIPSNINPNTLLFVPIFCIIITCTLSVWTAIINGATLVYASLFSSLYVYLVFIIVPEDLFWISFIILMPFVFIMTSTAIGRRWFNQLLVKKTLIDITIILYFSPRENKGSQIWDSLMSSLMIVASILVVGLIVAPTLATRLFQRKIIKTLNSTRILFRGVGYQMEASVSHDEREMKKNSSFTFPMFPHPNDIPISSDSPLNDQSVGSSNDIEEDDLLGINLDPINNNNNNNNNNNVTPLNQTMSIPIPTQPDQSPESISSPDHSCVIPDVIGVETVPSPPSIDVTSSSSEGPSTTSSQSTTPGNTTPKQHRRKHSDEGASMPKNKSFKKLKDFLRGDHKHSDTTTGETRGPLPLSRSTALEKELFSKKMSKKQVLSTAVLIPSEGELAQMEIHLVKQIDRLTKLLVECRQERWNLKLIGHFERLLTVLEMNQKQLISIKLAVSNGFSYFARQEILIPVLPFLDSIIEEVFLQIGLIIHILVNKHSGQSEYQLTTSILEQSLQETEALVQECSSTYKKLVHEYQRNNLPLLDASEVSKIHFFIFSITVFAQNQRQISDIIFEINNDSSSYPVPIEIIMHGLPWLIMAFPRYLIKRWRLLLSNIKELRSYDPSQPGSAHSSSFTLLLAWILRYFYNLWFANRKWKFPLQLSVAFTAAASVFYYFEGTSADRFELRGIWMCATVGLVMSPSLGATLTRGFHRLIGTVLGGGLGVLIMMLVNVVNEPVKQVILAVSTFIAVFSASFVQQDVRFSYAGAVFALTLMIITYGEFFAHHFTYMIAVNRIFNVSLGIIWVIIVSLMLFPFFTYKTSRFKYFEVTNTIAETFIKIVDLGLRLESDGSPEQRAVIKQEIAGSIRKIRVSMSAQKGLIYDIKSELAIHPKMHVAYYLEMLENLSKLYTRLVAFDNAFDYEFSDDMLSAMAPIRAPLKHMITAICRSLQHIIQLVFNQAREEGYDSETDLNEALKELDLSFQGVRQDLLQRKVMFKLHPEMIQFGSGIYSLRDFVKHYISVVKSFERIKRDQSRRGGQLRNFILRMCD
ncbi:hypothetical protein SAMD00019534_122060, partial [Acytostelium subglobosum LB1]|uniref:hypothetical protein n=1 Tax=Acytostelium subglobosum LB1 TaxID=1410327 RepID=UPI000644BC12